MYGADTYAGGDNVNNRETTHLSPIVTLSTNDNLNLIKQLNEGFKRSVYWNECKSKIEIKEADANNLIRFPLDASFHGVNRLFVLAFGNTINGANRVEIHRKYVHPRVNITNYNVLIDGQFFYYQNISDQSRKCDDERNAVIKKGQDCTTGSLLNYKYFKNHYQLIAVDLSKQKELDADPRAIQQIEFYGSVFFHKCGQS